MKRFRFYWIILLILAYLTYSFLQHYHMPLDGDMANIVLGYKEVLKDPFGIGALLEHKIYGAPNRFLVHWMMSSYFKSAPFFSQHFSDPLDSIYLACAFAKIVIQIFILWLLARYATGTANIFVKKFIVAAILITPLFQTAPDYNMYMGIISQSITYTFFYPLPLGLLMLFFLPFFLSIQQKQKIKSSFLFHLFMLVLAIMLPFSGPLISPIVLIAVPLILVNNLVTNNSELQASENYTLRIKNNFNQLQNRISKSFLFYFALIFILSLYSLYIGKNNSENLTHTIPILKRYSLLPLGIYYPLTQKLGLPLLLFMILVNIYFMERQKHESEVIRLFLQFRWILLFIVIYILLLPLGGYRDYRPNIIRSDTLMPVILCMFYIYAVSTSYLISHIASKYKMFYSVGIVAFLLIYVIANISPLNQNDCERNAFEKIAHSPEKIVFLDNDCRVMAWGKINDYQDSKLNCQLLEYWGVIKGEKYYFQK